MILLFVFFYSISNIAQTQKAAGKVTRIGEKSYISQQGKLYEIDDKVVLAKLKSGRTLPDIKVRNISQIALDYYSVPVPDSIDVEKFVIMLEGTDCFEYVEYNCIYTPCMTPNDYYFYNQWHLSTINASAAWEITTGSPSVKVAVIDDGVELSHEDLSYGNDSYSNLSATDYVDYVSSTDHTPTTSHGTSVAGVIGAKTNNNYVGVAGVAGGYGCSGVTIISYRTDYTSSQIISAIYDAINKDAKVINLSIGGSYHNGFSNALNYAYNNGVTIVCSSGNDSSSSLSFPASHQYTIAVGSTNITNHMESSSNYGSGLDLVAPGVGIWTTCKNSDGNYDTASGTSFAAPQVAGVAALMLSANPNLTPSQIRYYLQSTCTKLSGYSYNNGWNNYVGYGLLNAFAAVIAAMNLNIVGPHLICTNGTYSINNLPSCLTAEWSLSDSYYNQNNLQQNYPAQGQCRITRNYNQDLINATLTATIKYNGVTIQTLTKTGVYAYNGFKGHYTSGNLSGDIDYTHVFYVKPNEYTTITSPNFYGATISYNNAATIPSFWEYNTQYGDMRFVMPTNNNNVPIMINVTDECNNYHQLYAMPQNYKGINIFIGENVITVTLSENGDSPESRGIDQPWTVEVRNATTGRLMATQSATGRSATVSTAGWPKGIYIVKATIGNEVLKEKVTVR